MPFEWTEEEQRSQRKQARIRTCNECSEYIYSNKPVWNWGRCWAKGVGPDKRPNVELDTAAFEGSARFCPLGKWSGLKGKGEAEAKSDYALTIQVASLRFIKRNEPLLRRVNDVDVALDEMVAIPTVPGERPEALPADVRDQVLVELVRG